ncbi:hypothetical protein OAH77_04410 [Flavobacteriaceae bacterium]|nr:hypothetical protein [Flavobacteriaceae bacterium]
MAKSRGEIQYQEVHVQLKVKNSEYLQKSIPDFKNKSKEFVQDFLNDQIKDGVTEITVLEKQCSIFIMLVKGEVSSAIPLKKNVRTMDSLRATILADIEIENWAMAIIHIKEERHIYQTYFDADVSTIEKAKAFLTELYEQGHLIHPDDDANQIFGNPFGKNEADQLNQTMDNLRQLPMFDVYDFCLNLKYDTVIRQGELYVTSFNAKSRTFITSSSLAQAKRWGKDEVGWFIKNNQKYPDYELEHVEKEISYL